MNDFIKELIYAIYNFYSAAYMRVFNVNKY